LCKGSEHLDLKEKTAFLFDIIKRYDHYVATTNFKVGLMMSFVGAILLGLTIRVMSITPSSSGCNYLYISAIFFSTLTILCSLLAAINLLRAVFPVTKTHDADKSLIFFGDVASCENGIEGYTEKIGAISLELLLEDLSKQTFIVAEIINEKFRILKISVRIIIYGVVPLLAFSLLLFIFQGVK
jgi:hypothetical protein